MTPTLPLPYPVCGVSHCNEQKGTLTLSPCVSVREYRGSTQRARGLEYKQDPPIPPLSGGEVARETEEKWARTVRAKRVPQTPTATVATSQKPDNRGGASWFVLLAAEKNEQTKCISCIRDYLWRGKKIISIQPSPPAVPRNMARCHKTIKLNFISKAGITLLPCVPTRNIGGVPIGRRG